MQKRTTEFRNDSSKNTVAVNMYVAGSSDEPAALVGSSTFIKILLPMSGTNNPAPVQSVIFPSYLFAMI